jgi:hypothetical protein
MLAILLFAVIKKTIAIFSGVTGILFFRIHFAVPPCEIFYENEKTPRSPCEIGERGVSLFFMLDKIP